jgi:hypothetical protein
MQNVIVLAPGFPYQFSVLDRPDAPCGLQGIYKCASGNAKRLANAAMLA